MGWVEEHWRSLDIEDIPERVVARVLENATERSNGCIESLYKVGNRIYPSVGWRDHERRQYSLLVHRVAYVALVGPIPAGMTVDHECRNGICRNPAHLRLMTNEDNGRQNGWAAKTHCPAGHPYDESNTYRAPGRPQARHCRACMAGRKRKTS